MRRCLILALEGKGRATRVRLFSILSFNTGERSIPTNTHLMMFFFLVLSYYLLLTEWTEYYDLLMCF